MSGTIYINGKIFTSDERRPYAEAMWVSDGRIRAIGSESEVAAAATAGAMGARRNASERRFSFGPNCKLRVEDLKGRRVIPGLVDAHMHALLLADYSKQISALPPNINSVSELSEAVREEASHAKSGAWIRGWGYDEGKLAEHRAPTRKDLDAASPDNPVCIVRSCVHIVSANSKALELAGIDRDTPDPAGGHIVRDENGEPTGILEENARLPLLAAIPSRTMEEKVQDVLDLGELLLSQGIVAATDMGCFDGSDPLPYYEAAAKQGLKQEIAVYYFWDTARESGRYTINDTVTDRGRQVHVAGLKLVSDGSYSGRTAWVDEPYLGGSDCGMDALPDETLESAIAFCKENACRLSIHAMGGRAIARIVDRICREENWLSPEDKAAGVPFVRMEHVTEPRVESIEKAAEKGIAFATQPIFQYCEIESYLTNLGPERTKTVYPIKYMLEKGVKTALSTDAPATSWAVPSDPWVNMKAACTRRAFDGTDLGQDQCLDIETALRLYTKEGAEICGFKELGMLAPGYKASFAVLENDPFEMPADELDKVRVAETYVLGERVYERRPILL